MNSAIVTIAILCGVAIGWLWARWSLAKHKTHLPKSYMQGLNFLLNEQPDQAIDLFTKLLAADNDNVEMHFALGQLFRKRGEVDRAIHLHQHILARPQLDKTHRQQALLALGRDYLHAGMFDRAERVFQELSRSEPYRAESLQQLLSIYEQERDWEKAIQTAEPLLKLSKRPIDIYMAHYYCELSQSANYKGNKQQQELLLKKALQSHKNSARAALLLADLHLTDQAYKSAIKYYLKLDEQDSLWLSEAYKGLQTAYSALDQQEKFYQLLQQHLAKKPTQHALNLLVQYYLDQYGASEARHFLLTTLQQYPKLISLPTLLTWQKLFHMTEQSLQSVITSVSKLHENAHPYRCQHCGFSEHVLEWYCPGCHRWESIIPVTG